MAGAQACNWQSVAIMGGGFVPGLVYSPVQQNLLYARTDVGGFYRWDNANSRWIPLIDMFGPIQGNNFGGESIAPDPVNANVVYAAAGMNPTAPGTILSSTDQGNSWTANAIPVSMSGNGGGNNGREAGERLAVDPNLTSKLYFASRWQGLWVSTSSASSWAQVGSFPVVGDTGYGLSWVIFDPHGTSGSASATIYVGVLAMTSGNSNVYRSTNAGGSWTLIPGGPSNMVTPHASLGTDGNLWIVYDSGGYGPNGVSTGQIWKLNTGTLGWTNVTPSIGPGSGSGGYAGISVDANNARHVVVTTIDWWGGPDRLLSTTNGGGSWSIIALAGSGSSVFNVNGAIYQEGCSGGSGGAGWAGCVAIDPFNSNNAIYPSGGAGGGGGVWSSTNIQANPVSWTYTDNNLEETVAIYMNPAAAGGILFSCLGDVGGMRHTNVTQSPASGMYCNPQYSNTNMLDFAESRPNTVVRVGNSTNPSAVNDDVAYSTNNGQTWTPWGSAPPGYGTSGQMGCVAVAADGSRIVVSPYSGNGSPAYASSLGGGWTTCSGLPSGAMVASDRSNPSTFYATYPSEWVYGYSVTIYESTNYGASFTQVNSVPVNWGDANGNGQWVMPRPVFGQPGEFWISTYNALYRFTNAGSSVTAISNVYEPMGPVGFGKAAPGQAHPAVFLVGTVNGSYGFFRNDDGAGVTWTRINDANHQYGGAGWVEGDENIYGRCYIGAGGRGTLYGDIPAGTPTYTPTSTSTVTRTSSPTVTPTTTPTRTMTVTPTNTVVSTATLTFTTSPTFSPTMTRSSTPTVTQTVTPTVTLTQTTTFTSSVTSSRTMTATLTQTVVNTPTYTMSFTPTASSTVTRTNTSTSTPSATSTLTPTSTPTLTGTSTATAQFSFTNTLSPTVTSTPTLTNTLTQTRTTTATSTPSSTSTFTTTWTPTATRTLTLTPTPTFTVSVTPTTTPTRTGTATMTTTSTVSSTSTPTSQFSPTNTLSPTSTMTFTATFTSTWSGTPTSTPTLTHTPTATYSPTQTLSPTNTLSPTVTLTPTLTSTWSVTPTITPTPVFTYTSTATSTATPTSTATATPTLTSTHTNTFTPTASSTPTFTITITKTFTSTPTATPTGTATFTFTPSFTPTITSTISPTPTSSPAPTALPCHVGIYPNPVSDPTVQILPPLYTGSQDVRVELFTTNFRKVQDTTYRSVPSGTAVTVSLTGRGGNRLANGVYYVVVTTKSGRAIGKLLVLR